MMWLRIRIARIRYWLYYALEFLRDETLSLFQRRAMPRPTMILRGFHSISRDLYRLEDGARPAFLTDCQRLRTALINGNFRVVLNDKILFERVFAQWLPVPATVALVQSGQLIAIHTRGAIGSRTSWAEIAARSPTGVVARPIGGGSGVGIVIIRRDGDRWRFNGDLLDASEIERRLPSLNRYLLSSFVPQAEATAELNPSTTNTVRILTMIDPTDGRAFVARAVQRIGVRASAPVDNWSQGGLSALVDVETGSLSRGATKPSHGRPQWHATHQESGAAIEGHVIPNWPQIRSAIEEAAATLPMLPYVGWDVIPTDAGFAVIEGNYRSDVNLLQVHGPLLADERIRRFYRRHGIIAGQAKVT